MYVCVCARARAHAHLREGGSPVSMDWRGHVRGCVCPCCLCEWVGIVFMGTPFQSHGTMCVSTRGHCVEGDIGRQRQTPLCHPVGLEMAWHTT